jgi:two-component system nitrogen regulation response regulator NtrX
MASILIIDDEANILSTLSTFLGLRGHRVETAASGAGALERLATYDPGLILLDLCLGAESGMELLPRLRLARPDCPVVMISGHADIAAAIGAIRAGAWDFLEKPIDTGRLEIIIQNALRQSELRDELSGMRRRWKDQNLFVGSSPEFARTVEMVERGAAGGLSILITGPNGTGKEVLARYAHLVGDRAGRPFVPVNCAAIPRDLAESLLFGHRKGAFTGAVADSPGFFGQADGGVLFLDEIGELPLDLQPKLLRALESGEIQPVGGTQARQVSVRLVSATNRDLDAQVRQGLFREDLYYRLGQVPVRLPPLEERRADIPALIDFILAAEGQTAAGLFTADALDWLAARPWPGNVRELKNMLRRLPVLCQQRPIDAAAIRSVDGGGGATPAPAAPGAARPVTHGPIPAAASAFEAAMPLREARQHFERLYLETQLARNQWSVKQTAQALDVLPNNLSRRLGELGIRLPGS